MSHHHISSFLSICLLLWPCCSSLLPLVVKVRPWTSASSCLTEQTRLCRNTQTVNEPAAPRSMSTETNMTLTLHLHSVCQTITVRSIASTRRVCINSEPQFESSGLKCGSCSTFQTFRLSFYSSSSRLRTVSVLLPW